MKPPESMTDVEIFIPCFVDQLFPETAANMVRLLIKAGCTVSYNGQQTCCGQPAYNAGFVKEASKVGKKFVKDFSNNRLLVCPAGSCTGFVRNYYPEMLPEDETAQQLRYRLLEFTEYLVDILKHTDFEAELPAKAVYHDACGALRECGIKAAPRKLLEKVKGLELVEAPDAEVCCGFGGTFAVKYEPISVAMAEQKVENALALDAEIIISTDLSCLMQLQGYIDQKELRLKCMHIADVLATGLD